MRRGIPLAGFRLSSLAVLACAAIGLTGSARATLVDYEGTLTVTINANPLFGVNPPTQTYVITGKGTADLTVGGKFILPPGALKGAVRSPTKRSISAPLLICRAPSAPMRVIWRNRRLRTSWI